MKKVMSKKKCLMSGIVLSSALLLSAGNVLADNITIYDGAGYNGTGVGYEDSETEPGMVNSQAWDLEGFFLDGNKLSMVGGYDFLNGVDGIESGDIFLSTDDVFVDDSYTSITYDNERVQNSFGYEFVIDLDFSASKYTVYGLDENSFTKTAFYPQNENAIPGSNPWRYDSAGEWKAEGFFSLQEVSNTGFNGGTHYSLTGFDLSFLGADQEFYSHFTMGCGNDNLMGHGTTAPVPEPATMLLFGTGLVGLASSRLRKKKK